MQCEATRGRCRHSMGMQTQYGYVRSPLDAAFPNLQPTQHLQHPRHHPNTAGTPQSARVLHKADSHGIWLYVNCYIRTALFSSIFRQVIYKQDMKLKKGGALRKEPNPQSHAAGMELNVGTGMTSISLGVQLIPGWSPVCIPRVLGRYEPS